MPYTTSFVPAAPTEEIVAEGSTTLPFAGLEITTTAPATDSHSTEILMSPEGLEPTAYGFLSGNNLIGPDDLSDYSEGGPGNVDQALSSIQYTAPILSNDQTETVSFLIETESLGSTDGIDTSGTVDVRLDIVSPPIVTGGSFPTISVTDTEFGNTTTDAATITLTDGVGDVTDLDGILSGPGLIKTGAGTYSIAGSSPTALTTILQNLTFTPTGNGQASVAVSVTDTQANLTTTDTIDEGGFVTLISGTVANQPDADQAINPFSSVQINTDTDSFTAATAIDTAFIYVTDPPGTPFFVGNPTPSFPANTLTDSDGILSGPGLVQTGVGSYSMSSVSPSVLTAELKDLTLTPIDGTVSKTTSITLYVIETQSGSRAEAASIDSTTSVITPATPPPLPPTIAGVVASQSDAGAAISPFAAAMVTDPNAAGVISATLTIDDPSGTPTDADGTLSGVGVYKSGIGTYGIAASINTPSLMAEVLDDLVFTPVVGTAVTTATLSVIVTDAQDGLTATASTSVTTPATPTPVPTPAPTPTPVPTPTPTPTPPVPVPNPPLTTDILNNVTGSNFLDGATPGFLLANTAGGSLTLSSVGANGSTSEVGAFGAGWSVDAAGNGNGIFLEDDANGVRNLFVGIMGDGNQIGPVDSIGAVGEDWSVVGAGDFTDSGTQGILLQQDMLGLRTLQFLPVQNGSSSAPITTAVVPDSWTVDAIGPLTSDPNQDDLLMSFTNAAGQLNVEQLNVANGASTTPQTIGVFGAGWQVDGIGNFNATATGTGNPEILLEDDVGSFRYLYAASLAGGSIASEFLLGVVGDNVTIDGIGKFSGDKTSDIAFSYNNNGQNTMGFYQVESNAIVATHLSGATGLSWKVS